MEPLRDDSNRKRTASPDAGQQSTKRVVSSSGAPLKSGTTLAGGELLSSGGRVAGSNPAASGSSAPGCCRLLWRGKFVGPDKIQLHGIAIVAHLFAVPSLLSPHLPSSQQGQSSPFDDPFSPFSVSTGSDLCLGLEMLRGGDIKVLFSSASSPVVQRIKIRYPPTPMARENDEREGRIQVETPVDIRVYLDQRCEETVKWFEGMFAEEKEGKGWGIKLDVGGEEVIIFATYPSVPSEVTQDPTVPRPRLCLLIGRASQSLKSRKPRPDDPMPRETLFASKLRRTNSLPATASPASSSSFLGGLLSKTKPPSRLAGVQEKSSTLPGPRSKLKRSKTLMSLLDGKKTEMDGGDSTSGNKGKGKEVEVSSTSRDRPKLSRTTSSSRGVLEQSTAKVSSSSSTTTKRPRPPGVGTPGRRGPKKLVPRIISDGEDDNLDEGEVTEGGGDGLPASPTPSISMSTYGDGDDEDSQMVGSWNGARGMKRSVSVPSGVIGSKERSIERSTSVDLGEGMEAKNRATIRKIVLARLTARGIQRQDEQFKDLFSMTSKGVQFGLRTSFKTRSIDKPLATRLADSHIDMYISPSLSGPTVLSSSEEEKRYEREGSTASVKVRGAVKMEKLEEETEDEEGAGDGDGMLPSPESLNRERS